MSAWQPYRDDIVFTCTKHKQMAEKALAQLGDEEFFRKPGEHSNSVAAIVKHVGGNLASRWTDFLTSDGDKPWRDRDGEFVIGPADTRAALMAAWEHGWSAMLETLASLEEADWLKTVRIRGEEHTVLQAIQRSVTHSAYHIGQIVYLSRLLTTGEWQWITIPPGQSGQFKVGGYLKRPPG
jgi:uncharacterized damage-inducible protein DinB